MTDRKDAKPKAEPKADPADHHLTYEMACLGWLLVNPSQGHALGGLAGSHFSDPKRGHAFEIVRRVTEEAGATLAMIKGELVAEGCVGSAAAVAFLADCREAAPPSAAGAEKIAEKVRTAAMARAIAGLGAEIADVGRRGGSIQEMVDQAETALARVARQDRGLEAHSLEQVVEEDFRQMEAAQRDQSGGLSWGPDFDGLDRITGGIFAELIVVAARPSVGKSSLAAQVAFYLGVEQALPGAVFTLEMSRLAYVQRMLCQETRVNTHDRRFNRMGHEQIARWQRCGQRMKGAPLRIIDSAQVHVSRLKGLCRRLRDEIGLRWVMVDYLQMVQGVRLKGDSREREVSSVSAGLKELQKELGVPVIVVASLNRGVEHRQTTARPRLSDLRESGSIESDADVVILLHRPGFSTRGEDGSKQDDGTVEVLVEKNRNGAVGMSRMLFQSEFVRFAPFTGQVGQLSGQSLAGVAPW